MPLISEIQKETQLYCIISLKIRHKKNLSNNERFFVGLQGLALSLFGFFRHTFKTHKNTLKLQQIQGFTINNIVKQDKAR